MHSKSKTKRTDLSGLHGEGVLYVVATPIGNLEDITYRAVRILGSVDLIAAEDTRNTARLLSHFEIHTKLISCHDHNEDVRSEYVIDMIKSGQNVALVSDAGTPLISDPGYRVVEAAASSGIKIVPVPGASSLLAALSASGLPVERFVFMGFAPRSSGKKKAFLEESAKFQFSTVYFESPHRIIDLLKDMLAIFGDRSAVLARELTKMYEEIIRGSISEIIEKLSAKDSVKGEIVLIVGGPDENDFQAGQASELDIDQEILGLIESGIKASEVAKKISEKFKMPRQVVYSKVLDIKNR